MQGALREIIALFQHRLHFLGHNAFIDNAVNELLTYHFMSIVLKFPRLFRFLPIQLINKMFWYFKNTLISTPLGPCCKLSKECKKYCLQKSESMQVWLYHDSTNNHFIAHESLFHNAWNCHVKYSYDLFIQ